MATGLSTLAQRPSLGAGSIGRRNTLVILNWSEEMKQRRRIYYSTEQKREIWDRWKHGESAHEIGRLFDWPHSSIFKILMKTGGLRPPERRRSKLALTLAEREEISRGLVVGLLISSMLVPKVDSFWAELLPLGHLGLVFDILLS